MRDSLLPVDFKKLICLVEYADEIFRRFYDELLSNKVFSKYFNSDKQVRKLLLRQKQNLIETLHESRKDLLRRYYQVGVVHYQHDIPYEVFLSGTTILRNIINDIIAEKIGDIRLILLNEDLFDFVSDAMAKGYMDVYIRKEKNDLQKIITMTKNATFGAERDFLIEHYKWMMDLLTAIEQKDYQAQNNLVERQRMGENTVYSYIKDHLGDIEQPVNFDEIEQIRFRLVANTENIFFYLKREAYYEVLSLIINILEIYKLTLVLDNIMSNIIVKQAQSVISEKVRLSETDPLTNAMNRRKFEELLSNLLVSAQQSSVPLGIIVLDIDDFKQINDSYGHQTGDRVLVELVHLIRCIIRKNDRLVRYGGEEFVVICANTELEGVQHLAEKIRADVESNRFREIGQVTVSLGVAGLNEKDDTDSLFKRADQRLYEAKAEGKNCVCF